MKYEVGDVVVLKNEGRPKFWNAEGQMDRYLGKTVKIALILDDLRFRIKGANWTFRFTDINTNTYLENYEIY